MRLNVIAPWNPLGYGVAASNIVKTLVQQGIEVAYWPIGNVQTSNPTETALAQRLVNNQKTYDSKAPSIRIWHQFDLAMHVGTPRIGFPIFELDQFNPIEQHHLKSVDQLFVCSQWAKDVIANSGIQVPTSVIPLGVDTDLFYNSIYESDHSATRFFNIGKWEKRKGHDVLIEMFNKAFSPQDNVELWMMNHNPFLDTRGEHYWKSLYTNTPMGEAGRIRFLPRVETHREVADIIRQCDCGVFPSRAEGWNLEALETLACGKTLIITDYSAHSQFCTPLNSSLIHINRKELANDGIWFKGQGKWAAIEDDQIAQAVEHMRAVHELKQTNKLPVNTEGIQTAMQFSWDNSANKILEACYESNRVCNA